MLDEFTEIMKRAEKFWSFVKVGGAEACWEWTGTHQRQQGRQLPYGMFYLSKTKKVRAHRATWCLTHATPLPAGNLVCHSCDNVKCCNPKHLWLGTPDSNNKDRAAKGRSAKTSNRAYKAVNWARGERHGSAVLSADEVAAIRLDRRSSTILASEYNVHFTTICRVRAGTSWRSAPLIAKDTPHA